ncbi:MAG: FecR domain-containing protein [Pseudomonadota bacterium]
MKPHQTSKSAQIRSEAHNWVVTMEALNVSDTDRRRFEQWLDADARHAESYDRAITIREALGRLSFEDIDSDLRIAHQRLGANRERLSPPRLFQKHKWMAGFGGAIAACALLAVILLRQPAVEDTPASEANLVANFGSAIGEQKTVALPDGTQASLDDRTELEIAFSDTKRIVAVRSGSVFFDVAKDAQRPFYVTSGSLTAVALGTRFEFQTSEAVHRVGVEEGAVEVRYPLVIGGRETAALATRSLGPGQAVAASPQDGLGRVEQVPIINIGAWRNDRLVFRAATIAEFAANLNRRSSIPIVLNPSDDFSDLRIDGVFVGGDVERLLLALTEMHPIEIDRSEPSALLVRRR